MAALPTALALPCTDCPWRTIAIPGWLGPYGVDEWLQLVHGDAPVACHQTLPEDADDDEPAVWALPGVRQCAGAARYRANVAKRPRDPDVACGPRDDAIFSTPMAFRQHHYGGE